jgi:malate/lactate dehydrogenase
MKVGIVGSGFVGAAAGYALVMQGVGREIGRNTTATVAGIQDVTVSLPRLVGGPGVLETFPLPLSQEETAQLHNSAQVVRCALDEIGEQ